MGNSFKVFCSTETKMVGVEGRPTPPPQKGRNVGVRVWCTTEGLASASPAAGGRQSTTADSGGWIGTAAAACVSLSGPAAVTTRLGTHSRHHSLTDMEAGWSQIKVLADLVLGEDPFHGLQMPPSCCVLT